jgi:hypothetical protein
VTGPGRYDDVPVATTEVPDGVGGTREVRYLRRRRPPATPTVPPLAHHRVADDDRLDLIASRYLGDPLAAWRVADANAALDPQELTAAPGTVLTVPTPEA